MTGRAFDSRRALQSFSWKLTKATARPAITVDELAILSDRNARSTLACYAP
jgi:hypothetical protein